MVADLDSRGVSEILGAIVVFGIMLTSSVAYLSIELGRAKGEVAGITDMVRAAEHRQAQLLSLVYYAENRDLGLLRVYVFNYGTESAVIERFFLDGEEVSPLSTRDAFTGIPCDAVEPKSMVELTFSLPVENTFDFTLVTKWRAVYSLRLTVG